MTIKTTGFTANDYENPIVLINDYKEQALHDFRTNLIEKLLGKIIVYFSLYVYLFCEIIIFEINSIFCHTLGNTHSKILIHTKRKKK